MKYTANQLAAMATTALQAKARNDARYLQPVLQLALSTGLAPAHVEQNILALAQGVGAAA